MDTSTSCNSTSTSALVKLDLRLLDRCSLSALTWLAYELLSCRFGRFWLHTSVRLRALIRSWQGVYVCKSRCTRTRVQFKNVFFSVFKLLCSFIKLKMSSWLLIFVWIVKLRLIAFTHFKNIKRGPYGSILTGEEGNTRVAWLPISQSERSYCRCHIINDSYLPDVIVSSF